MHWTVNPLVTFHVLNVNRRVEASGNVFSSAWGVCHSILDKTAIRRR